MKRLIKLLFIIGLASSLGAPEALATMTGETTQPAATRNIETVSTPAGAHGLNPIREPATATERPAQHLPLQQTPQPDNWGLLLGALLTGGYIVRRRLA